MCHMPGPSERWVPCCSTDEIPSDALLVGSDADGAAIYAGRADHHGCQLPAKVIPSKNVAYVACSGSEHAKDNFEILCGKNFRWEQGSNGSVPECALAICTSDGEIMYYGRCLYDGTVTPGKVHPSHGCLYIPYGGEEIPVKEYEVLVRL